MKVRKTKNERAYQKQSEIFRKKKDIIIEIMNSSKAFSYTIGRNIDWYKYLGKLVCLLKVNV